VALHCRRSAAEAEQLAGELEARRPGSSLVLQAELANLDALPALIDTTIARFGRLDALVNNASAFYPTPVGTATAAQWNELFASNAQAPFFLAQAAAPALKEARGAIVNLVDIYAERPLADHPIYCMAKAALAAMTRSLALDLAPDVRVNGIAPGAVMWPSDGKPYDDQQAMLARTPLRRGGAATSPARCCGCCAARRSSPAKSSASTAAARCRSDEKGRHRCRLSAGMHRAAQDLGRNACSSKAWSKSAPTVPSSAYWYSAAE
jgi:pteridine reductase